MLISVVFYSLDILKPASGFVFISAFFLELRNPQGKHKIYYSDKSKDLQRNRETCH